MPETALVPFPTFAATCAYRLDAGTSRPWMQFQGRRPGNALNVEIAATPADRCAAQPPTQWQGADPYGRRWLGSGGSPLVFGRCCAGRCPVFPLVKPGAGSATGEGAN